ncbi:MAG: hypothetical protein ACLQKH_15160 [Steroidobacteraceae bacterium]
MFNKVQLQNMLIFLKRVQLTGEEAPGWMETYNAAAMALNALTEAEKNPPKGDSKKTPPKSDAPAA